MKNMRRQIQDLSLLFALLLLLLLVSKNITHGFISKSKKALERTTPRASQDSNQQQQQLLSTPIIYSANNTIILPFESFSATAQLQNIHIAKEASGFLEERELKFEETRDMNVAPNVYTYARVIHIWAREAGENRHRGDVAAVECEKILHRMIHLCDCSSKFPFILDDSKYLSYLKEIFKEKNVLARPNTVCFNSVMDAWANAGAKARGAMRCEKYLNALEQLYDETGISDLRPDVVSYATVLNAWAQSGSGVKAAQNAERILERMVQLVDSGKNPLVAPNLVSYNTVLNAWAKSGEGELGVKRAEELLSRMGQEYRNGNVLLAPDVRSFNTVIDAWARSGADNAGSEAEVVLERMSQFAVKENRMEVFPTIVSFNTVIDAWSKSKIEGAPERAEQILNHCETLFEGGSLKRSPNVVTYNGVINAYAKSKNTNKAVKAWELLQRMEKLSKNKERKDAAPDVFTYSVLINACAFTFGEVSVQLKAFKIAFEALKQMKKKGLSPNNITYKTLFKACANLLPSDSPARETAIARIFHQCCKDGMMDDHVLAAFYRAAKPDQISSLLGNLSNNLPGNLTTEKLPKEWSERIIQKKRRLSRYKPRYND